MEALLRENELMLQRNEELELRNARLEASNRALLLAQQATGRGSTPGSELPTALTVLTEPPQHSSLAGQTPDEVWAIVASFLASSRDLRQLSCTAKRFRNPAAIKAPAGTATISSWSVVEEGARLQVQRLHANTASAREEGRTWLELMYLLRMIAESVIVDSAEHAAKLEEWLPNEQPRLELLYRASSHGWQGDDFHQRCDDQGPTLIVIKDVQGFVFGGYTEVAWASDDRSHQSPEAFLFALRHTGHYDAPVGSVGRGERSEACREPLRMALKDPMDEHAVNHGSDGGFLCGFGLGDLSVFAHANEHTDNTCWLSSYECPDTANPGTFLTGANEFQAAEVEAFRVHTLRPRRW
jgi:hypothetical protein